MPDIAILSGEASILPGVPDEIRAAVIEDLREEITALKARLTELGGDE